MCNLLGQVGLDLMAAALAPHDQPRSAGERLAEGQRSRLATASIAPHYASANPRLREREDRMSLIVFLLIGAIAGWLAGKIMQGSGYGLIGDIAIGVIGSLIGGWLFGELGIAAVGFIGSVIAALVGAIILIVILRAVRAAV
jgi:uncharacterized membrane protein YeaQ/YmgE (transglycosylase-associated protein family)